MRLPLLGFGCALMLAVAAPPITHANDRAPQRKDDARHDDRDDDGGDKDDRDGKGRGRDWRFKRVGTFANFRNAELGEVTVSEIVAATPDGRTLIYTDAERGALGFIDITRPHAPQAAGTVALDPDPATAPAYSPTSVAVFRNRYVLVAVDTSVSKKHASGELQVLDLATRARVATVDLGGQPDSVKVSPDGRYIAVVVENERDETLCVGGSANDQTVSAAVCTAGGGRLGGVAGAPDVQARDQAQARGMLDALVRRPVLAEADRVVRQHVDHALLHQR